MDNLKEENEQLKQQVEQLRKQLHALYKEKDKNDDPELITEIQSDTEEDLA
jgi:protein subunit release factor A